MSSEVEINSNLETLVVLVSIPAPSVMAQNLEDIDLNKEEASVKGRTTGNGKRSNKCNQCEYASSHAGT